MGSLKLSVKRNFDGANRRNHIRSLGGFLGLELLFVLRLEAARLFDKGLGLGLIGQVESTGGSDGKAKSHDDTIDDASKVNDRSPFLVGNAHSLECRRNSVEQVHTDDEHANHVEGSPGRITQHLDSGEPHVADDFSLVVHVQVVFAELEHHEVLHEETENEETGPDHGEGGEGLLALADVEFVVDTAAGLLVFDLQLDGKEDMEGEGSHQHQFDEVNHLDGEVERIEPGQELGVGVVGRLSRSLIEIQKLEVTTHVAEDEQGEERAGASHDLLLTNGRGKILDDPLH